MKKIATVIIAIFAFNSIKGQKVEVFNLADSVIKVGAIMYLPVEFGYNNAKLKLDSNRVLFFKKVSSFIQDNPENIFCVEYHTTSMGDSVLNKKLSDRRALEIMKVLAGYNPSITKRLNFEGLGGKEPLVPFEYLNQLGLSNLEKRNLNLLLNVRAVLRVAK